MHMNIYKTLCFRFTRFLIRCMRVTQTSSQRACHDPARRVILVGHACPLSHLLFLSYRYVIHYAYYPNHHFIIRHKTCLSTTETIFQYKYYYYYTPRFPIDFCECYVMSYEQHKMLLRSRMRSRSTTSPLQLPLSLSLCFDASFVLPVPPMVRSIIILSLASLAFTQTHTCAHAFTPVMLIPSSLTRVNVNVNGKGSALTKSNSNGHRVADETLWTRLSSSVTDSYSYSYSYSYSHSHSHSYTYIDEADVTSSLYAADLNDSRYSASDWFHNIMSLPRSSILKEIKGPIVAITIWSTFISILHLILRQRNMLQAANAMTMSAKPHSMLVSALGLLLVFRTNSAYQRFAVSAPLLIIRDGRTLCCD